VLTPIQPLNQWHNLLSIFKNNSDIIEGVYLIGVVMNSYYERNKEKILKKIKLRFQDDIEYRNHKKEYSKKYYIKNKESINLRNKKWKEKQRIPLRQFVNKYLEENPCVLCGEKDIDCLQFHHIVSTKEKISYYVTKGKCTIERIKKEISKCQVLCVNCHTKLHNKTIKYVSEESKKGWKAKQKIRHRAVKREYIINIKKNNPCYICKENDYRCLAFHHKNPEEKEIKISSKISWEKLKNEIAKCILVCCNCHFKIHSNIIGKHMQE